MTTYCVLGKRWRCRKCQKGYYKFGLVLGRNRGFLIDRVSGPMSRQGFPVSRHGSQAAGTFLVTT